MSSHPGVKNETLQYRTEFIHDFGEKNVYFLMEQASRTFSVYQEIIPSIV
jgi:hypothetical protein